MGIQQFSGGCLEVSAAQWEAGSRPPYRCTSGFQGLRAGACAETSSPLCWPQLLLGLGLWLVREAPSSLLIGRHLMLSEHWGAAHSTSRQQLQVNQKEEPENENKLFFLCVFLSKNDWWFTFRLLFRKVRLNKTETDNERNVKIISANGWQIVKS